MWPDDWAQSGQIASVRIAVRTRARVVSVALMASRRKPGSQGNRRSVTIGVMPPNALWSAEDRPPPIVLRTRPGRFHQKRRRASIGVIRYVVLLLNCHAGCNAIRGYHAAGEANELGSFASLAAPCIPKSDRSAQSGQNLRLVEVADLPV